MLTADAKAPPARTAREAKRSKREAKLARQQDRERFRRARLADRDYSRKLRKIAKGVSSMIASFAPKGIVENLAELEALLYRYADVLAPWARMVASRMLADVNARDKKAWKQQGEAMGISLTHEIQGADVGTIFRKLMAEQVQLITSLPRKAAERVHKLAIEGLSTGVRAKAIARDIYATGHVTEGRAMLIARTETSRAATNLTEARALHIGSEGYFWETSKDADVRDEHKHLQGKFIRWSNPPIAGSNGMRYHAGAGPNCRCWPRPEIPQDL